jgi:hypothetical protein
MSSLAFPLLAAVDPIPGSTYIIPALFLFFVATTVAGTLIAVAARRIIRSVCGLASAASVSPASTTSSTARSWR